MHLSSFFELKTINTPTIRLQNSLVQESTHDKKLLVFLFQNKLALGLPATNKQVSLLMNIEYEVRLPDHDFTVAPMHKLRPSVIVPWKNVFKRGFYILWPYICSNHECQTQPIQCFTSLRGHEAHSLIRWS